MARKRGGLAGIWDRNKGIIKTAVPAALSFIPGVGVPLAAAAGAAMGGLDRPGKSGIGLDVMGGIKGGISGYGIGKGTQAVAGGVRSLLAPRVPDISGAMGRASGMIDQANAQILSQPAMGGAPTSYVQSFGAGMPASEVNAMREAARRASERVAPPDMSKYTNRLTSAAEQAPMRAISAPSVTAGSFPSAASNVPGASRLSRFAGFARENKDLIGMGAKGLMSQLPNQRGEAELMVAETGRMRLEEEQRQAQIEEQRRRAIMQLLAPYVRQNAPLLNLAPLGQ